MPLRGSGLQTTWALSLRYVDTALDRPRWRSTLNYRVFPALQVGVEYNPAASEVSPLATWFVHTEQGARPALFLGTSSDRIGSPAGTQSYYATVAKNLDPVPVSAYASLNWSEWDDAFNVPFGLNAEIWPGFTVQPMYDGHRTHLLGVASMEHWSVTAIWAWLERAGVAVSVGF